jgi:hypothetical protein
MQVTASTSFSIATSSEGMPIVQQKLPTFAGRERSSTGTACWGRMAMA